MFIRVLEVTKQGRGQQEGALHVTQVCVHVQDHQHV